MHGAENAIAFAETEAAAEFSGAGRILAQAELLDAIGIHRLLQLDGNDARVAMRHGAERAGAVVRRAGAPAAVAAVVAVEERAVVAPAVEAHAGMGAEMGAGHALGQRRSPAP